jgi:hypothetical protein
MKCPKSTTITLPTSTIARVVVLSCPRKWKSPSSNRRSRGLIWTPGMLPSFYYTLSLSSTRKYSLLSVTRKTNSCAVFKYFAKLGLSFSQFESPRFSAFNVIFGNSGWLFAPHFSMRFRSWKYVFALSAFPYPLNPSRLIKAFIQIHYCRAVLDNRNRISSPENLRVRHDNR